jgi:hypothetical protein
LRFLSSQSRGFAVALHREVAILGTDAILAAGLCDFDGTKEAVLDGPILAATAIKVALVEIAQNGLSELTKRGQVSNHPRKLGASDEVGRSYCKRSIFWMQEWGAINPDNP